jgi:hypothetical protein
LERQICSILRPSVDFEEVILLQEQGLENLRLEVETLREFIGEPLNPKATAAQAPAPQPPVNSLGIFEFPMKEANSVDGIISYLTKKHGGNVHEKGVVIVTVKSIYNDDRGYYGPQNAVNLTSNSQFSTKDAPGQWICWNFGQRRIRLTHYTLRACKLKSWVVEGSPDGSTWTEIDRKTDNQDFSPGGYTTASFAVSNQVECRYIRLTQTTMRHCRDDCLKFTGVEFFGSLCE